MQAGVPNLSTLCPTLSAVRQSFSALSSEHHRVATVKAGTHRPNRWTLEAFVETQTRSGTNLFGEAFGATRASSAPIQPAKSEEEGCLTSESLDSLIGCVLANQRGVWEGRNTVHFVFLFIPFRHSLLSCFAVLAQD